MDNTFLYKQLSNRIQKLIESKVLSPGEKLTSIRAFSKEQNVSISTVYKAYEELVIRDFVEARPKSGYYVKYPSSNITKFTSTVANDNAIQPIDPTKIITFAQKKFSLEGMIKLSITAPDISLLPVKKLNKAMNLALRSSEDSCLNYGNISGNLELRRHIASQSLQWQGEVHLDDIVITQGCIESLVLSLMAITSPGDIIAIERPTYFSIYNIINNLGLEVLEIDLHPDEGLNFQQLEKGIKKFNIKACVFITNFNNPTGYCMKDAEKEAIVELLSKYEIPLIEDDIYGDIYFQNSRPKTCKSFDKKGLVILCSSFSKTLAPGYRVGWCIPGKFKDRFLEIKLMHTVSTAAPSQAAIAQFFNSGRYDLHMNKLRKSLHIESIKYRKEVLDHFPEGTRITSPKGGLGLWIELGPKVSGLKLFYEALENGISIWPGQIFSASKGFNNFIRITFGIPMNDKIKRSLKKLGELSSVSL